MEDEINQELTDWGKAFLALYLKFMRGIEDAE